MISKGNTAVICFSPYFGGMEMDAFRIAKLLAQRIDVTLIVKHDSQMDKHYRDDAEKLNICFESISFLFTFSPSIIYKTRKIISKKNIKNVIFFGASELSSLYFSFLGMDVNLIVRHGTTKSTSKKDIYHQLVYSKVNYHIAICEHIAKNVRQIIPLGFNSKVKVIYSSLRHFPDALQSLNYHANRPVTLLHVARITDGKGQIDAIKACDYLFSNKIPFKLILVGEIDSNYAEQFNETIEKIPYKSHIELPGYTTNVSKYYKSADIFIFPSKGEGLSNSFIEALSYGLICISYNNTSFPELKQLGFDFFIAKDGNIDDLRKCLLSALQYLYTHETPLSQNTILAKKIFGAQREFNEYIDILI